jgi:hypothetical protein
MSQSPAYNIALPEVLRIVGDMHAATGSPAHKARAFAGQYPDFKRLYPVLFEMACKPGMNMEVLSYMVTALQTHGEGQDTEVMVGQKLVDTYVTPALEAAPGA